MRKNGKGGLVNKAHGLHGEHGKNRKREKADNLIGVGGK
jgi:hypothetical protein